MEGTAGAGTRQDGQQDTGHAGQGTQGTVPAPSSVSHVCPHSDKPLQIKPGNRPLVTDVSFTPRVSPQCHSCPCSHTGVSFAPSAASALFPTVPCSFWGSPGILGVGGEGASSGGPPGWREAGGPLSPSTGGLGGPRVPQAGQCLLLMMMSS